jgi:hypothetical protein
MNFTGIGLYILKEAQRFTGAQPREVSRWLFGDPFKQGTSDPLWRTQLVGVEAGQKFIDFRDLLELRIVKAFIEHNVSLRVIRGAGSVNFSLTTTYHRIWRMLFVNFAELNLTSER